MPQAVGAWVFQATVSTLGIWGASVAADVAYAATFAAVVKTGQKVAQNAVEKDPRFQSRELLVRSSKEPQNIVYGKAWVGGVIRYMNQRHTPGTKDNYEVYVSIVHAAHECTDITDVRFDDDKLTSAVELSWTNGRVESGKYGISKLGNYAVICEKALGTNSDPVSPMLSAAFPTDWTSAHTNPGYATTTWRFLYFSQTANTPENIFYSSIPQNIRVLVTGRKIYDPRYDSTNGGSGSQRFATPSTWQWSENPILCMTDYLTQYMGIPSSRIDWPWVITQANICDVSVAIRGSATQKRFTCNGVVTLGMTHEQIRDAIMSSCMGVLREVGGKYRPTAGAYSATEISLDESMVCGDVVVTTARKREERYNSVKASYASADDFALEIDSIPVTNPDYETRDGGFIEKTVDLPMTNNEYMAQRICYKTLLQSNEAISVTVPLLWPGLRVVPGARVQFTYAKYGWSRKIFRCVDWKKSERGSASPITAVLVSDSALSWLDPSPAQYSVRSAQGVVTLGTNEFPTPLPGAGPGEITARNTGFEFGAFGWVADNSNVFSILNDTSSSAQGDWCARAKFVSGAGTTAMRNTFYYPVAPGRMFTVGGAIRMASGTALTYAAWRISWRDRTLTEISTSPAQAFTSGGTDWQYVSAAAKAPSGASYARLEMAVVGMTAGNVYFDDGFLSANTGAKFGETIRDSNGNTVNDDDALNSAQILIASVAWSWTTDSAGAWPAGNPTHDLTLTILQNGSSIGTMVVRGTLNSTTGNITCVKLSSTGVASTYSESDGATAAYGAATWKNVTGYARFAAIDIANGTGSGGGIGK